MIPLTPELTRAMLDVWQVRAAMPRGYKHRNSLLQAAQRPRRLAPPPRIPTPGSGTYLKKPSGSFYR